MQLSVAFEVVDVLEGFVRLERRDKTLGGSVPLRVAQACLPLLEGNAFGFQITLSSRLALTRTLGAWALDAPLDASLQRRFSALWPLLVAQQWIRGSWTQTFAKGPVSLRGRLQSARAPVELFTGLLLRPKPELRLRVSSNKNRRSLGYDVREAIVDDGGGWTPLVLCIDPREASCVLDGELATLGVLPARASFQASTLASAPDMARAHLEFYDRAYFETKRSGEVSRSYRRQSRAPSAASIGVPHVQYVDAGVLDVHPAAPRVLHRPDGPAEPSSEPDRLVVRNAVALSARFDGLVVDVAADAAQLAAFAACVRACWAPHLPADAHPGALLYLSKYVTPHPRGEPHFFVKPSVLFRTEPGVSMLLEGASFAHAEVLRGVLESDWFGAAPAVFQLDTPHVTVTVPKGAQLLELFAWPRHLEAATFSLEIPTLLP